MAWLQLSLPVGAADFEELSDLLMLLGAVSVTALDAGDQPILEPDPGAMPLWDQVQLQALWPLDADLQGLQQVPSWFAARQQAAPALALEFVADADWSNTWREGLSPRNFGGKLWVVPSAWESPEPLAGARLVLDPGLAFGTGTHPTTALCLQALAALPLTAARVLDYGCGSGILGIAALLLGAKQVLAVDHDPQALLASADNLARNQLDPALLQLCAPDDLVLQDWQGQADVLVANILADPLIALAPRLCGLLRPGGVLLLSGILAGQWQQVVAAYPHIRFREPWVQDDWVCLQGQLQ